MVNYVVKPLFAGTFAGKGNGKTHRAVRVSIGWCWIARRQCYTLPNVAPYQLGYTRIFGFELLGLGSNGGTHRTGRDQVTIIIPFCFFDKRGNRFFSPTALGAAAPPFPWPASGTTWPRASKSRGGEGPSGRVHRRGSSSIFFRSSSNRGTRAEARTCGGLSLRAARRSLILLHFSRFVLYLAKKRKRGDAYDLGRT